MFHNMTDKINDPIDLGEWLAAARPNTMMGTIRSRYYIRYTMLGTFTGLGSQNGRPLLDCHIIYHMMVNKDEKARSSTRDTITDKILVNEGLHAKIMATVMELAREMWAHMVKRVFAHLRIYQTLIGTQLSMFSSPMDYWVRASHSNEGGGKSNTSFPAVKLLDRAFHNIHTGLKHYMTNLSWVLGDKPTPNATHVKNVIREARANGPLKPTVEEGSNSSMERAVFNGLLMFGGTSFTYALDGDLFDRLPAPYTRPDDVLRANGVVASSHVETPLGLPQMTALEELIEMHAYDEPMDLKMRRRTRQHLKRRRRERERKKKKTMNG